MVSKQGSFVSFVLLGQVSLQCTPAQRVLQSVSASAWATSDPVRGTDYAACADTTVMRAAVPVSTAVGRDGRPSGRPLAISPGHHLLHRRPQVADLLESGGNARVDLVGRLLAGLDQELGHFAHRRHALLERALAKFRFLRGKLGG
jgi:hypothetical protein